MTRLLTTLCTAMAMTAPQLAWAQTYPAGGNNPTVAGFYVEGMLGVGVADESDFEDDVEDLEDFSISPEADLIGSLAVGYSMPMGQLNFRGETEFTTRTNPVDELEFEGGDEEEIFNSNINLYALMVNAHADYYVMPNVALTVGVGIGYTNVKADIEFVDDDASGFAYQGRAGARYHFSPAIAATVRYTYFKTAELSVDNDIEDVELEFDYASHGLHVGLAYHF